MVASHAWEMVDRFDSELDALLPDSQAAIDWILCNCDSYERMDAVLFLQTMYFDHDMTFRDWLFILGSLWVSCDNIGAYRDDIVEIFKEWADDPLGVMPELINDEERAAFDHLPDEITVLRGCGPQNKHGLSWSLSREIASRFPFSQRFWADQPLLLTATIPKARAAALKLGRREQEVIVIDLPATCWTEEIIIEPPPKR
jgi:hypothetical protein